MVWIGGKVLYISHLAMNFDREPPQQRLTDMDSHLHDVHITKGSPMKLGTQVGGVKCLLAVMSVSMLSFNGWPNSWT